MMKSIKFLFRPSAADITDDLLPLRYPAFTTKLVKLAPRHSEIPHRFGLVVRLLPAAGKHLQAAEKPLVLLFRSAATSAVYAVYQLLQQRAYHL